MRVRGRLRARADHYDTLGRAILDCLGEPAQISCRTDEVRHRQYERLSVCRKIFQISHAVVTPELPGKRSLEEIVPCVVHRDFQALACRQTGMIRTWNCL